ncbi:MAG TPA: hypothetical protein VJ978_08530 [Nitriliruptoraceae bacterium]|nr:hypothetical protein [Nitriliruptoraceae bacterium]
MLVMHPGTDDGARAAAVLAGRAATPVRYRPVPDVAAILAAVDRGTAAMGVVPLEDSHDGLCAATVDGLAFDTADVVVTDEVDLREGETTTRWVTVATVPPSAIEDPQTLLFVIPQLNRPGTLLEMVAAFSSRGLNLTRIGTRPLHGTIGMYGFLLEVEGSPRDVWLADALADVLEASSHLKFLGTFPAGQRAWSEVSGRVPAGPDLRTLDDLDALAARVADS